MNKSTKRKFVMDIPKDELCMSDEHIICCPMLDTRDFSCIGYGKILFHRQNKSLLIEVMKCKECLEADKVGDCSNG